LTAKVNGQESNTWLRHVLERLPYAQSMADYEALLPWNCSLEMPRQTGNAPGDRCISWIGYA
jgi:hypothetical protein